MYYRPVITTTHIMVLKALIMPSFFWITFYNAIIFAEILASKQFTFMIRFIYTYFTHSLRNSFSNMI